MKKTLSFMVMAFALLFTQCRKPEVKFPTPSAADEGTTVSMTVTAGPGSKTDISTTGAITWSTDDKLYVGDGTKYIGCLTLQSGAGSATGTFIGDVTLTGITEGVPQTFHFFYLGSGDYTSLMKGSSTFVDVDFSSQNIYADVNNKADDNKKLVNASAQHVGYGSANGTVTNGAVTGINVTLVSKVALAHFSFKKGVTGYSNALTLSGTHIYNKMTVNFNSSTGFSFSGTEGDIALGSGNAERYVMLVPVGTESETLSFAGDGFEGSTTLGNGIEPNKFYGREVAIEVKPIEFTVDADGTTVKFSPGNLQYIGSTDTWKFAEHQWDYIGGATGIGQGTNAANVDRDLFGWGCTGSQDMRTSTTGYQTNYQPHSTSKTEATAPAFTYNQYGYGPDYDGTNKYGLSVVDMSDWGCLAIGDDPANTWRTLTSAEWEYLLNTRTTTTTDLPESSRYAKATVNEVGGMLLFPDSFAWTLAMGTAPATTNNASAAYTNGTYTAEQFAEQENAGVVFLPAAGHRSGTTVAKVGINARYWSSSCKSAKFAFSLNFTSGGGINLGDSERFWGYAVRLVRE